MVARTHSELPWRAGHRPTNRFRNWYRKNEPSRTTGLAIRSGPRHCCGELAEAGQPELNSGTGNRRHQMCDPITACALISCVIGAVKAVTSDDKRDD